MGRVDKTLLCLMEVFGIVSVEKGQATYSVESGTAKKFVLSTLFTKPN
jgi:hypothetical protein